MSSNYSSQLLELSVAQVCLTNGWQKAHPSALHYLSCLLERYLRKLGHLTMRSAELNNRTEANMDDLAFVFAYLRIDMEKMAEYYREVPPHPLPYEVPIVSVPNSGHLILLPPFTLSRKRQNPKEQVLPKNEPEKD